MKKLIIIASLILAFQYSEGQKLRPYTIGQVGITEGGQGGHFLFQAIQGIQSKRFGIGIGAGLDYYVQRSVPVFLDLRYSILPKSKSMFLYGNGGYHFPWKKELETPNPWMTEFNYKGGIYYDLGLGLQVPILDYGFLFSIGYSYKYFERTREEPWNPQPSEATEENALRRIVIKAGFRF